MSFLACLPLIESDLPAVLDLDQRCLGGLWTKSGYQRELDSDCSDLLVLLSAPSQYALQARACAVATVNQDAPASRAHTTLLGIGCLWAILEEAHITTLAVEPTQQGRKLGQLLLAEILLCGYCRGLERATLEVRASNRHALKLYQKFNFQEAGIRKRYYADGENARILWRSKLQNPEALKNVLEHRQQAIAHLGQAHQQIVITQARAQAAIETSQNH